MKRFTEIVRNDFRNYLKFNILQIVVIFSLLFAAAMAFFPSFDAMIFIYVTVFIFPVILFAISIYIESEERRLIPWTDSEYPTLLVILAKICSSLILLIIPFVLDIMVMRFVLNIHFNVLLFFLVYVLAAIMHVVIGTVLAIVSKSSSIMSASYIAYIILFSLIPIFYTRDLIPDAFQYVMVISPAYLSGILFQQIYFGYIYSPDWLIVLAVVLQVVYIGVLTMLVIRPYFKSYLILPKDKEEEAIK